MQFNSVDVALTGLGGVVLCWLATHRLAYWRYQEDKLRNFIHFLSAWRTDIERLRPDNIDGIWRTFVSKVPEFAGHSSNIRRDVWRKRNFDSLCEMIRAFQGEELRHSNSPDPRDLICGKIDNLLVFLGAKKK
jgi:hypothetical protein